MHISNIEFKNYRGALSLTLNLHSRLNVFVGANGAGKSTILDAAAIMLSWVVNRIQTNNASGRPIAEHDITNRRPFATISLEASTNDHRFRWRLAKSRKGHRAPDSPSHLTQLTEYTKQIQAQIASQHQAANLPLFVYYPVNRAVLDIPLRIRGKHSFDQLTAYDDALTSGANFRTFFEWFREREDLENESYKSVHQGSILPENEQDYPYPDPQLETVRQSLEKFMPAFRNLTVRRNPLRMEVEKQGQVLTVNQLSDGEKCLMAMIADLARRLAIANPTLANPQAGAGIVLIDEIDLHLHPKWQRMIVPQLLETFPNCQFVISTHSPHVITHVQPESLFLLQQTEAEGMVAEQPTESYGKNVDRILEDLMGLETTRPRQVTQDLHQIYEMIERSDFEAARQRVAEIRQAIGADPDLTRAEVLIRRKELLGK